MAKQKNSKPEFKEFKMSGKIFEYSGRVYEAKEGTGKVKYRSYVSLTLNDSFTINGIYLVETEDKKFLTFPQYKSGEAYKSYVFIDEEAKEEIEKLVKAIDDVTF